MGNFMEKENAEKTRIPRSIVSACMPQQNEYNTAYVGKPIQLESSPELSPFIIVITMAQEMNNVPINSTYSYNLDLFWYRFAITIINISLGLKIYITQYVTNYHTYVPQTLHHKYTIALWNDSCRYRFNDNTDKRFQRCSLTYKQR